MRVKINKGPPTVRSPFYAYYTLRIGEAPANDAVILSQKQRSSWELN